MKSILDRTFKYTNAASTDLAKTFARIRAEQKKADAKPSTVAPFKRKEAGK